MTIELGLGRMKRNLVKKEGILEGEIVLYSGIDHSEMVENLVRQECRVHGWVQGRGKRWETRLMWKAGPGKEGPPGPNCAGSED